MLIKEFRISLPISVEDYQIGQLFCVAEASLNETGGGEGVEVIRNEPYVDYPLLNGKFTSGQYTKKIYHLDSKVPALVRWIAPKGALQIEEEAWNAYPYCKTVLTNPGYMKDKFFIKIESYHLEGDGSRDNVHELPCNLLKMCSVDHIDIVKDKSLSVDYKASHDPSLFRPATERRMNDIAEACNSSISSAPAGMSCTDWRKRVNKCMTCYKLVTVEFKWIGLQGRIESFALEAERRLFLNFNRQVWCSVDKWSELTMADIRRIEDETKTDLEKKRQHGKVQGTVAS